VACEISWAIGDFVNLLQPKSLSRGSAVAFLVAGAIFMENLDGTVIVTALPQMAKSFHVQPLDLNIGVSAYLLTLAALIPVSGWIADRFGIRSVFAAAIVIFTAASILCGLCQSLTSFTLARILQGVGGAMMVPVGRLAVLRTTEKHELISAIATITWPGLAAPILGPPLGGFISTYATWHWIFFLNGPLGIAALLVALRLLPRGREQGARPFDGIGFILTGAACFALIYGLELVSREQASRIFVGAVLLCTAGIWLVATFHARRHSHPLLDLRALKIRSYAVTIWGGSLFRIAISSIPFLLPLLFQIGFGLNAFTSGLLVLSVFAGNMVMKPCTTPILRRFPFRTTLIVNGCANAIVIFACALLIPSTPVSLIVALLFASGLTRSMQYSALNTLAFAEVPESWMTVANTLFNMTQQLSMAMGIAMGAVALRIAGLWGPRTASGTIPVGHFHTAFLIVGAIALMATLDVVRLDPSAGDSVRQPKARQISESTSPLELPNEQAD
jgi:EmrB/QacA subfamily drug resistance transporter